MIPTESCAQHAEAAGEIVSMAFDNGIVVGVSIGVAMAIILLAFIRRPPPYVGDDDLPEHELGVGSS